MARSFTDEVQERIGYRFRRPALLADALTHKSYVNEQKAPDLRDNERLEFLGDAVLSLVISEYLAETLPQASEGDLSKLKARLVSEGALAAAARGFGLGPLLRLGRGEDLGQGRDKSSVLANALEAVIAAVYLDGGLAEARKFILQVCENELQCLDGAVEPGGGDYKTRLQEWCQRRHEILPQYETVRESGPDHDKLFEVRLTVQGRVLGEGSGRSKKEAEQMAAKAALGRIRAGAPDMEGEEEDDAGK
jgi:ribonuclease-3